MATIACRDTLLFRIVLEREAVVLDVDLMVALFGII